MSADEHLASVLAEVTRTAIDRVLEGGQRLRADRNVLRQLSTLLTALERFNMSRAVREHRASVLRAARLKREAAKRPATKRKRRKKPKKAAGRSRAQRYISLSALADALIAYRRGQL